MAGISARSHGVLRGRVRMALACGLVPWRLVFVALLLLGASLGAQERVDPETLAAERARVASLTDIDEATRSALLATWDEAQAQLAVLASWERQLEDLMARVRSAPAQLDTLKERLAPLRDTGSEPVELALPDEPSVETVQPLADRAQAELNAARDRLNERETERDEHEQQRGELPARIAEATDRRDALQAELATLRENERDAETRAAEGSLLQVRVAVASAELAVHQAALAGADSLSALLDARLELARHEESRASARVDAWRAELNSLRALEATQAVANAEAARQALIDSDPRVRDIADRNAVLAGMRAGPDGLATKLAELPVRTEKIEAEVRELRRAFDGVREKVTAVGLTQVIGVLLIEQRGQLEDLRVHEENVRRRAGTIDDAHLLRIERREELSEFTDVGVRVEQILADLDLDPASDEYAVTERTVRELLDAQRESLVTLRSESQQYIEALERLDSAERKLLQLTREFADYIDERVLWVRIAPPLHDEPQRLFERAQDALDWLFDGRGWADLVTAVSTRGPSNPLPAALQGLVLLVLVLLRPLLLRRLNLLADLVARLRTDRFIYTVRAVLITVLLAAAGPLALWFAATLLEPEGTQTGQLARGVEAGLRGTALAWFALEIVRKSCRARGLAEAHFRWPAPVLLTVRRHARWLLAIGLPALFVHVVLERHGDDAFRDSLGRLAFLTSEIALAVFLALVLRPEHGVLRDVIERHPNGWLSRLRWIWFPMVVGLPLVLGGQAWLGYWYTAMQLQERVRWSALLILSVLAGHALVMRWLYVARRQLAVSQALRRRAQAESTDGEARSLSGDGFDEGDDADIDVGALSEQSRRLVQTSAVLALGLGMFLIWVDVLPALRILDEVDLWHHTTEVEELVSAPDGTDELRLRRTREAVTLADLVLALLAVSLTAVAARNLPGLLEISVLQRLPMTRAGRYAFTSLTRYAITVLGVVFAFGAIGIGWGTVQWLAAGVSVGLGFGLQEIFANFVSGLIILFERPVRVGDTVTVGGVIGTVMRIHMRATTIQTWDRTEFVVPNREFITGQLVNWTLTDSVMRVIVRVGVAYGSDTQLATRLLHEIAMANDDVLNDPLPRAVFTEFGDSTLDFELRLYVDDPELYRSIHHGLNMEIDRRFREEGIEIAFPQRDLHVRSFEVPVPLQRGTVD